MKVKCIRNYIWPYLTIGKTYDIHINNYGDYIIIDDSGNRYWYPKSNFKPFSEMRNDTINKLLE